MANTRGSYAKGIAKRSEILEAALSIIDQQGYGAATVKQLADAVGLSQTGVLRYFGTKETLFVEILRRRDEALEASSNPKYPDFEGDLVRGILNAVRLDTEAPGMIQLTLRLVGEATESGHAAHDFFRSRFDSTRLLIGAALRHLQSEGRMDRGIDPEIAANLIFASIDGLRLQWMYAPSIDIVEHISVLLKTFGIVDAPNAFGGKEPGSSQTPGTHVRQVSDLQ
ncbi:MULTISPECIES: TetR/AcrR family transcriptional regulator [unclassified Frondihabitans]|uniref:TetR/AcrR family transcriptional regulator n=1 Tax=unclassified Frondihabitans TaxID=2626248 RepID=UPI000F5148CF|nr:MULTISPECIES: TetR/AcrR family transcriptional regulator [unclassified Frondihabitans]RPE77815.1 TetR family transcriptional regulator [Frondihabitans sp. PhB153]RPF08094.1 TetR family transcriptional regulator [Frondihabitans sp. PhB161]